MIQKQINIFSILLTLRKGRIVSNCSKQWSKWFKSKFNIKQNIIQIAKLSTFSQNLLLKTQVNKLNLLQIKQIHKVKLYMKQIILEYIRHQSTPEKSINFKFISVIQFYYFILPFRPPFTIPKIPFFTQNVLQKK